MPARLAVVAVLSWVGVTAAASAAVAAQPDPPGANGTVKIDGEPLQAGVSNEPHVPCDFAVEFFDFDQGERANIVFKVWKPSGPFVEVLRLDDELVSDDPATGGAKGDPDRVFEFSASDLGLPDDAFFQHPKQGYHVKLTVERLNHPGWTEKHKVFWLPPCAPPTSPSTPGNGNGGPGNGNGNGNGGGGELPITGPAAGGIALLGAALVAGGTALLIVLRRRRDVTFIS